MLNKIRSMILGHTVGDALGVPVEFSRREKLKENPVVDMREFGTYNMPKGAWSDDTTMVLCLMESLSRCKKIDYKDIMTNFAKWVKKGEFTPTGKLFDIGNGTHDAIRKFMRGAEPLSCGGADERSNGNGSLMRIAPVPLYAFMVKKDAINMAHNVSMLTHAHSRSLMACGIYTLIALNLLNKKTLSEAIELGLQDAKRIYSANPKFENEVKIYGRLWNIYEFIKLPETEISSSGYVVDTLEAVIWCLLNTQSFKDCVLKAVNLGRDTDTIGAIAGGLAGLAYGEDNIPKEWINALIKREFIEECCDKFANIK